MNQDNQGKECFSRDCTLYLVLLIWLANRQRINDSSHGLNAGNSITFWQIPLLINCLLLTSHYGNNSHCSHMFSVWYGAFLSLNYRDQEWRERSWAIVLIFLCTPLTLINYGTSAVKRQNINRRKEKQDIFPSNYAKCAWCPHKQTNEQLNDKHTDSGSSEWQWSLYVSTIFGCFAPWNLTLLYSPCHK